MPKQLGYIGKLKHSQNVKPSVQFKVDMAFDNLVTVDKKTQTLIINILEKDYNRNELSGVNPSPKKHKSRNEKKV